jgi:YggT family protein
MTAIFLTALRLCEALLLMRVILSWIQPGQDNRFVRLIYAITEPVLEPVRRILPIRGSGIDFSPLIVFLILDVIKRLIFGHF